MELSNAPELKLSAAPLTLSRSANKPRIANALVGASFVQMLRTNVTMPRAPFLALMPSLGFVIDGGKMGELLRRFPSRDVLFEMLSPVVLEGQALKV